MMGWTHLSDQSSATSFKGTLMKSAPTLLCLSAAIWLSVQTTFAIATVKQWERLGQSLEGRLHAAVPVSAPCFDIVNGKKIGRNGTACAEVQAGYTQPDFRFPKANAFMFVSDFYLRLTSEFRGLNRLISLNWSRARGQPKHVSLIQPGPITPLRGMEENANREAYHLTTCVHAFL